jgi:hypothetical protein
MGLASEWEDFKATLPEHAPKREIEIMRRGYYVGADTMLHFVISMKRLSKEDAQHLSESLVAELNAVIGSTDGDEDLLEGDSADA